jgi:hypothetical protein
MKMNYRKLAISALALLGLWACADDSATGDSVTPGLSSSSGAVLLSSGIVAPGTSSGDGASSAVVPGTSSATTVPSSSSVALPAGAYEKLTTANASPGWGSRYWDGCKPHCAQRANVDTNAIPFKVCKNCGFDNQEIASFTLSPSVSQWYTGYEGTLSSCEGGPAYACFDMAPLAVNDTLAYAYAATSSLSASCGQCFQLQFDGSTHNQGNNGPDVKEAHRLLAGKTLIVMAVNIGTDVVQGQFDIQIPGGGVGIFNSFSNQLGVSKDVLGVQYGGLLRACQDSIANWDAPAATFKTCVAKKNAPRFSGGMQNLPTC